MYRRVNSSGFITKVMKRRPDDTAGGSAVSDGDNSVGASKDTSKKTRFILSSDSSIEDGRASAGSSNVGVVDQPVATIVVPAAVVASTSNTSNAPTTIASVPPAKAAVPVPPIRAAPTSSLRGGVASTSPVVADQTDDDKDEDGLLNGVDDDADGRDVAVEDLEGDDDLGETDGADDNDDAYGDDDQMEVDEDGGLDARAMNSMFNGDA